METIVFDTVQAFNNYYGIETLHPMVSVVRFESESPLQECIVKYNLYALFLKENKGCKLSYGRTKYDFDEMTVTSFAPGQNIHVEPNPNVPFPKWTALVFHPDFLNHTSLGRQISRYGFFSYSSNEALHLSASEVEIYKGVLSMISTELKRSIDKHTHELIVSNIELLLNYCLRFYDRQFVTRAEINHSVVKKFDNLLNKYIKDEAATKGLPSVAYFAEKCCLSTNYFGELVKAETGQSPKSIINERILAYAKELLNTELSITQVSNQLGFEYAQHFARFFKTFTGQTPSQYRMAN